VKEIKMNTKEMIEVRNKTMVDAQALLTKENLTTGDRSTFDRMIADAEVLTADITRMQSLETFNAERRKTTRPPRAAFSSDDATAESAKQEKRAFKEWFRTGQVNPELRRMSGLKGGKSVISVRVLLRPRSRAVSNQVDSGIKVSGCVLNASSLQSVTGTNSQGTAHGATPGGQFVYAANFVGVNGLVLDRNTIYDSGTFEIFESNDSNVYNTNNTIYPVLPVVAKKFTDCIHLIGPDTEIYNQNNTETCGDDSNAYNADDGNRTGSGDANAAYVASDVKWGPITQWHDDNNTLLNSYYGIRLYSATELIDQGEITNLHGNLCGNTGTFAALAALGTGNIGTVRINGWNLPTSGTCNSFSFPYNFYISSNFLNLDIVGVQETNPGVNWPMITMSAGTGGVLSLSDWKLSTQTSSFSNVLALNGGTIRQISASAIT
jgi:hypothetical protein